MNDILIQALRKILAALIRVLLRNGFAYGDFDRVARQCYVDVAFKHLAQNNQKQTVSTVAILTGLNRKEVKRLHELDASNEQKNSQNYNRCIRVIGGWLNDELFLTEKGTPADLAQDGENSFSALVKKYSGDMPVVAMEKALISSGNISVKDKQVRLLNHAYVPSDDPVEKLNILGSDTQQLIETIDFNLASDIADLRFQRKASNDQVDEDAIPKIQQFLRNKGQSFLEEIDWFLSQNENKADRSKQKKVSVSLFYHHNSNE